MSNKKKQSKKQYLVILFDAHISIRVWTFDLWHIDALVDMRHAPFVTTRARDVVLTPSVLSGWGRSETGGGHRIHNTVILAFCTTHFFSFAHFWRRWRNSFGTESRFPFHLYRWNRNRLYSFLIPMRDFGSVWYWLDTVILGVWQWHGHGVLGLWGGSERSGLPVVRHRSLSYLLLYCTRLHPQTRSRDTLCSWETHNSS